MGETFTFIVVGAVALFALVGVISWLAGGSVYDQIGESGFGAAPGRTGGGRAPSDGRSAVAAPPAGLAEPHSERDQEIRQMLQARSDRRVRRGESPLDIDAELARLTGAGGASSPSAAAGGRPSRGPDGSGARGPGGGGPGGPDGGGPGGPDGGGARGPGGGGPGGPDGGGSGGHDAALAEEVRQLVVARNERRARRGEPPLDVDAEVQRTLRELDA